MNKSSSLLSGFSLDWDNVVRSDTAKSFKTKLMVFTDGISLRFGDWFTHYGFTQFAKPPRQFITGSVYKGHWNAIAMEGFGTHTCSHTNLQMTDQRVTECGCKKSQKGQESVESKTVEETIEKTNVNQEEPSEKPQETTIRISKDLVGNETAPSSSQSLRNDPDKEMFTRGRARSLSYDWDNVVKESELKKIRRASRYNEEILFDHERHRGYIQFERSAFQFCSGSTYTGRWNSIGMDGEGTFDFPHKVQYEGNMRDGMFHGEGMLTYPMGQKLEGEWVKGKLVSFKFKFRDSLEYDTPWKYCKMPDRRFFTCIQHGLRPAGNSLLTNAEPTRKIPEGCYDTGDGFYNPATKCVWSAIKPNKILRIPTAAEEKWIMENCRKAWDEPTRYRPDLYEHWATGRKTDSICTQQDATAAERSESEQDSQESEESLDMIVPPTYSISPASSYNWWETNTFNKVSPENRAALSNAT